MSPAPESGFNTALLQKTVPPRGPWYPKAMMNFAQILQSHELFILSSHVDPDGDGLGGCLGLQKALQNAGKTAYTVLSTPFSDRYRFLPGSESILFELPSDLPEGQQVVLITVDAPNIARLGFADGVLEELNPFIVNLDHHTSNEGFGDFRIFDEKAAASCEVIYELLRECSLPLSEEIGTSLYCGILTDTGRFRFSNTRPQTLRAAAALLEAGANHQLVIRKLFEDKPYGKLQLEAEVLSTMRRDGPLAWVCCTEEMVSRCGCDDTEELVNRLTEIEGLEIAVFFREASGQRTKVSFRAINDVDVNLIASQFGGGGHAKAAGAKLDMELNSAVELVLASCSKTLFKKP